MVRSDFVRIPHTIWLAYGLLIVWRLVIVAIWRITSGELTQAIVELVIAIVLTVVLFSKWMRRVLETRRIQSQGLLMLLIPALFLALLALWDLSKMPLGFLPYASRIPNFFEGILYDVVIEVPTLVIGIYVVWHIAVLLRRHPPLGR